MTKAKILVVDDEEGMLEVCQETLEHLPDAEVSVESDSLRAAERLRGESVDLLITDIRMRGMDGTQLLRLAREQDASMAVLMITAFPTVETAVETMRLGAADYISKPFIPEDLLATVSRLLESRRLVVENRLLRRQLERDYSFHEMVGRSAEMTGVFAAVERLASLELDVLIVGPTGTGKELVARALHQRSSRSKGPFVPVDCGAIPDQLLESEFFGHERGAFSGAFAKNIGLMEYAHSGTLFMDEITQLTPPLQAKLLRVLQERRIRRVGGSGEIDLNVRFVFACALDIDDPAVRKRFRDDFYHRINVARIQLPPLCDRPGDVPLLIEHFLARYAREMQTPQLSMDPEALEVLSHYCWPGNVRELQNVLRRAIASSANPVLTLDVLPDEIVSRAGECFTPEKGGFFGLRERRMTAFEKEYFSNLMVRTRGDVVAAATQAELPRGTLYRLLKRHGLNPADYRGEKDETSSGEPSGLP